MTAAKPMTEREARAALKREMPWGKVTVIAPVSDGEWNVMILRRGHAVQVYGSGPTLRAAVANAIKAWRSVTKKRRAR